jgi:hypothetical protein
MNKLIKEYIINLKKLIICFYDFITNFSYKKEYNVNYFKIRDLRTRIRITSLEIKF